MEIEFFVFHQALFVLQKNENLVDKSVTKLPSMWKSKVEKTRQFWEGSSCFAADASGDAEQNCFAVLIVCG